MSGGFGCGGLIKAAHAGGVRNFGLAHFPTGRNCPVDKKSLKIKMLEQALIEEVYQLFRKLALTSGQEKIPQQPRGLALAQSPVHVRRMVAGRLRKEARAVLDAAALYVLRPKI